ncbi:MAG: transporter substrate-binding domain-containing protein, partial [Alphaproteobacteria bacterium]|nr:transporter substrate-binding domain-containing protein [Alphaproteobacteria bacterium]
MLAFAATGAAVAEEVLKIGVGDEEPFCIANGKGQLTGFEVEIVHALCATIGARCDIVAKPIGGVIDALDRGVIDMGLATLFKTPDREKKWLFTERYMRISMYFAGKVGTWPPG